MDADSWSLLILLYSWTRARMYIYSIKNLQITLLTDDRLWAFWRIACLNKFLALCAIPLP